MAGGIIGGIVASILPGVLPSITDTARVLVERLVPDPAARDEAQRQIETIISQRETAIVAALQEQNKAQSDINLAEASNPSLCTSGWRPAVAWVCLFGMAYSFILAPMVAWGAAILGTALGIAFPSPPTLDSQSMIALLTGLLGLSGLKTAERIGGVDPNVGTKTSRR